MNNIEKSYLRFTDNNGFKRPNLIPMTQQEQLDDENQKMAEKAEAQKLYSNALNPNLSKFMSEREQDSGLNALDSFGTKQITRAKMNYLAGKKGF